MRVRVVDTPADAIVFVVDLTDFARTGTVREEFQRVVSHPGELCVWSFVGTVDIPLPHSPAVPLHDAALRLRWSGPVQTLSTVKRPSWCWPTRATWAVKMVAS